MKGLIIKKCWLDKILSGDKIWEIRGHNTKIRGLIQLIESGTGLIVGCCNITNSIKLSNEDYKRNVKKHCIDNVETMPYRDTYAWVVEGAKRYEKQIPYKHPKGAVIWVNL